MDAIARNSSQTKMCRQCHRTKTLIHFVNKSNTGICIICKTCRENQMRRYYGRVTLVTVWWLEKKKMMMKKQDEKPISPTTTEPESTSPFMSFSTRCEPSNFPLPYQVIPPQYVNSYPHHVAPSFYYSEPVVPSQNWVVVPKHHTTFLSQPCTVAKVVYHPTYSALSN